MKSNAENNYQRDSATQQAAAMTQCTCNQKCLVHPRGVPQHPQALDQCSNSSTDHESSGAGCRQVENRANKNNSLINKPLIPLKVILFAWYAAGACLLPYMTLHMKQLGLNMGEMTAVYAILPIIQLLGTPIAGFIADRTGNYKSVLQLSLTTCIVTTLLIQYAVPARKTSANQPAHATAAHNSFTTRVDSNQHSY